MLDLKSTMKDIIVISKPLTVEKLISYILKWYETKSIVKMRTQKIPIMTETLLKKTKLVIKACKILSKNFEEAMALRIQQRIRRTINIVNSTCHMKKKQAPVIDWDTAKRIAKRLWNDTSVGRGSSVKSIRKRKAAATAFLLTTLCGGRWIDLHRIHWEDLKFHCENSKRIVQAPLRFSKNNLTNNLPQTLTWASNSHTAPEDCPWSIFKKWWYWCGKPRRGLVFSDRTGAAYKDGGPTYNQLWTAAKALNLPDSKVPRRHSGRVTFVLTLEKLNVSKRKIIRGMNWRSDQMLNYYMNRRDMRTSDAPALKIAALKPGQLSKLQSDLD